MDTEETVDTDKTAAVLEDLIETLEDGRKGFEQAAERIEASDEPEPWPSICAGSRSSEPSSPLNCANWRAATASRSMKKGRWRGRFTADG